LSATVNSLAGCLQFILRHRFHNRAFLRIGDDARGNPPVGI
jgi:hypothetical protein